MLPGEVAAVAAQSGDHCHWNAAGQHHDHPLTSVACPTQTPPLHCQMEPETPAFHIIDCSVCLLVLTRVELDVYTKPVSSKVLFSNYTCNSRGVAGRPTMRCCLLCKVSNCPCAYYSCGRQCLMLKQPGIVVYSPTQPGLVLVLAGARALYSTDAYLQLMVIATLPLCIAIGNLHTLHSNETGLRGPYMHLHRPITRDVVFARARTGQGECKIATASVAYAGMYVLTVTLNSMSLPSGSCTSSVHTLPSFHCICGALPTSQSPRDGCPPTTLWLSPKDTCTYAKVVSLGQ